MSLILNLIVTAIIIFILIYGMKFAGFGKNFHDDFLSMDSTKSIRGLAAIGVILHHISQESYFQNTKTLSAFVNAGPYMVAIFFFCSGYGLMKNMLSKEDYFSGFIKKRVVKGILITFYFNAIIYTVYYLIKGAIDSPIRIITNLLGLTLANWYAWFPVVLVILYIAFYFIFRKTKNIKFGIFLMFLVVFLQGVFFSVSGHFAWWSGPKNWWLNPVAFGKAKWWQQEHVIWFFGEWWVNSSISFIVGLLFAYNEEKLVPWLKKLYWLKLIIVFALWQGFSILNLVVSSKFGYYSEWSGKGPGILDKFVTYCSQLPGMVFYTLFVFMLLMKVRTINPITRFFGKYSLDTYLANLMVLEIFRFTECDKMGHELRKADYHLVIYFVAVFAVTIIIGVLQNLIVSKIKKIGENKKQ